MYPKAEASTAAQGIALEKTLQERVLPQVQAAFSGWAGGPDPNVKTSQGLYLPASKVISIVLARTVEAWVSMTPGAISPPSPISLKQSVYTSNYQDQALALFSLLWPEWISETLGLVDGLSLLERVSWAKTPWLLLDWNGVERACSNFTNDDWALYEQLVTANPLFSQVKNIYAAQPGVPLEKIGPSPVAISLQKFEEGRRMSNASFLGGLPPPRGVVGYQATNTWEVALSRTIWLSKLPHWSALPLGVSWADAPTNDPALLAEWALYTFPCKDGYRRSANGSCEPIPKAPAPAKPPAVTTPPIVFVPGTFRPPVTTPTPLSPPAACPEGSYWNPVSLRCEKVYVPPGTEVSCPEGSSWSTEKSTCVKDALPPLPTEAEPCPPGEHLIPGKLRCEKNPVQTSPEDLSPPYTLPQAETPIPVYVAAAVTTMAVLGAVAYLVTRDQKEA